jgi:murein DD-endopeptidase MepM/ murein hydrolase activator NlpD
MISPTGQPVRIQDNHGRGNYGARRDGGSRIHRGADFIATPGQAVVSPLADRAKVVRVAKPYADDLRWSGVMLRAAHLEIKMFYLTPMPDIVGNWVRQGDVVGYAQDISAKYDGMTPHIHLEICSINPVLFINYI